MFLCLPLTNICFTRQNEEFLFSHVYFLKWHAAMECRYGAVDKEFNQTWPLSKLKQLTEQEFCDFTEVEIILKTEHKKTFFVNSFLFHLGN